MEAQAAPTFRGQQQRVALRVRSEQAAGLLLDEPLGALDLSCASRCTRAKGIQHDMGITFVHVTHDQEEP